MNKTNNKKKWIILCCILLAVILTVLAIVIPHFFSDTSSIGSTSSQITDSDKDDNNTSSSEDSEDTDYDAVKPPTTDLPATVVIPSEKDPATGEKTGIKFPHKVSGYDMVIEKLAPYDGLYVEDGSNEKISDVAMLLVRNDGEYPIEYTKISVEYGSESLLFEISALPVGESVVAQEKNGKSIPKGIATSGTTLVVQRADMQMSDKVSVKDNGDNTLTVTNLTDKTIPTTRIFYKYYMKDENIYVGGVAFTSRITRLAANQSIVIHPSHYSSESSRIVMALTYND